MRSRAIVALLFAGAALAACSDAPTPTRPAMKAPAAAGKFASGWVDWSIWQVYPSDIAAQGSAAWDNIRDEYAAGNFAQAQSDYVALVQLLQHWMPYVHPMSSSDTPLSTTTQLVAMMGDYVFEGGEHAAFRHVGNDATFAIVQPGVAQTVVTPSLHAGVFFSEHSAPQTFAIVIEGNDTKYPVNCTGPLQTARCQYPQFYRFHPYPYVTLNVPTAFAVCHVNTGDNRLPLPGSNHDNYRLAHDKPPVPSGYVPGGTVPTEPGENIEILPLAQVSFMDCERGDDFYTIASTQTNDYIDHLASLGRAGLRKFSGIAEQILAPEKAYAIDQGGGGFSLDFSNFNVIDPLGVPDLSVSYDANAGTPTAQPGQVLSLATTAANVGTATASTDTIVVSLQAIGFAGPPPAPIVFKTAVASMVPLDPALPVSVTLPSTIPVGNYTATISIQTWNVIPESNLANNSVNVPVVIGTIIP